MDVLIYEGISYFLERISEMFDSSIDNNEYYRFSIRTNKDDEEVLKILREIANFYVRIDYEIILLKKSEMKNGNYNYVYKLNI